MNLLVAKQSAINNGFNVSSIFISPVGLGG